MLQLRPLTFTDIPTILDWNTSTDANWLYQWAGKGYTWPLTADQINKKLLGGSQIWRIEKNGKMLGTIELAGFVPDAKAASVCRFLIAQSHRSRGLGLAALKLLEEEAFRSQGLRRLELRVFDFNLQAIACYCKAGFREVNRLPNAWRDRSRDCSVILMVKERTSI